MTYKQLNITADLTEETMSNQSVLIAIKGDLNSHKMKIKFTNSSAPGQLILINWELTIKYSGQNNFYIEDIFALVEQDTITVDINQSVFDYVGAYEIQFMLTNKIDNQILSCPKIFEFSTSNKIGKDVDLAGVGLLDTHVREISKPDLDAYTSLKKVEMYEHTVKNVNKLRDYTTGKETQLDDYTRLKELDLEKYKNVKKQDLETHTTTKKTELDTYSKGKKIDLEDYKNTKKQELDTHTIAKETQLSSRADTEVVRIKSETQAITALSSKNEMRIEEIENMRNNVWIADDTGKKSLMVRIPRFKISDVLDNIAEKDDRWHPAFVVAGEVKDCIYISKYQNIVEGGRAYSLGGYDPKTSINFDQAKLACETKGLGWHLMTNAEWAAIALWSKKNNSEPLGNNYSGSHFAAKHLAGVSSYIWKLDYEWSSRSYREEPLGTYWHTGRTKTGSSPKEFSHTHDLDGIFDLNGNIYEWVGGMRLQDGEIQVIGDNDAAITGADMSSTSVEWKAMLQDGSYADPGTVGTMKYDNTSGVPKLNVTTDISYKNIAFKDMIAEAGITVPPLLQYLALAPTSNVGGDRAYINTEGEKSPIRGGNWSNASIAGVFMLYLHYSRSNAGSGIGFRSAFVL